MKVNLMISKRGTASEEGLGSLAINFFAHKNDNDDDNYDDGDNNDDDGDINDDDGDGL